MVARPKVGNQGRNRGIYFGIHVTDLCITPSDLFVIFSPYSSQSHIILVFWIFFCENYYFLNLVFIFWPQHVAFRILVPQPGIEPVSPEVEAQSLNHCATREVP